MNIAKIMIPKISTVFLYEKDTIRQGLERFMVHGYTAVPVLNDQEPVSYTHLFSHENIGKSLVA